MNEPLNVHATAICKHNYLGVLIIGAIIGYLIKENKDFKKGV